VSRFPKGYRKPTDSCDGCLAWGDFSGRLSHSCYTFGRNHQTAACDGCHRSRPLKRDYCRLCWSQARLNAKTTTGLPTVHGEVTAPWLRSVRHHQLFFMGLHYRRGSALTALHRAKVTGSVPQDGTTLGLAAARRLASTAAVRTGSAGLRPPGPGRDRPDQPMAGLGQAHRRTTR
jgi:hypothetical protein